MGTVALRRCLLLSQSYVISRTTPNEGWRVLPDSIEWLLAQLPGIDHHDIVTTQFS